MAGRNLPRLQYHGRGGREIQLFELDTSSAIRGIGGLNARRLRSATRRRRMPGRSKHAYRGENQIGPSDERRRGARIGRGNFLSLAPAYRVGCLERVT